MKSSFLISFLFIIFLFACDKNDDSANNGNGDNTENLLLQLEGTQIIDANKNPVYLQGIAFSNFIWSDTPFPEVHHSEVDYQRTKDMGMNVIRFYMNYRYFEDDTNPYTYKQSGWDWLDENIAWAKKYDIYLILNMHAPQGGYQSAGEGDALWDDVENQNRLVALWKAIAERYKDEVQIAGFGPVNEPAPNNSVDQWTQLAQKLIDEIRSVDKNHLLFIERANHVKGNPPAVNFNFPNVTGENIVYEFHGYDPFTYTHQLFEFSGLGDGGKYPDESMLEVLNSKWKDASFNNPSLPNGTSNWTYFEGEHYKITDSNIDFAEPVLVAAQVEGRVYFDDIIIKEYDENDNLVRDIYKANLNNLDGWSFWSINGSGSNGLSNTIGHNDTGSLYIDGTTGDGNMFNLQQRFVVKPNYSYQISGWMRGENVASSASCNVRLDFYEAIGGPVFTRNKVYLEAKIGEIADWAKTNNVTLYMGEFGAGYPCFQNNKGGLQFVRDMVDINKKNNIHFTYHVYHEDNFGLYLGGALPDPSNVNQPLIDLFTDILK